MMYPRGDGLAASLRPDGTTSEDQAIGLSAPLTTGPAFAQLDGALRTNRLLDNEGSGCLQG